MNRFSGTKDLTARVPAGGGGMDMLRLAMCGHKTRTTGAKMRGSMVMLCPACVAKKAAA